MPDNSQTEFDRLIAGLGASEEPTLSDIFAQAKLEFLKALDTVAKEHGISRETLASEIVVSIIASFMLSRSARRGNTAKTVRWGVSLLLMQTSYLARHQREITKRYGRRG